MTPKNNNIKELRKYISFYIFYKSSKKKYLLYIYNNITIYNQFIDKIHYILL